MTKEEEEKNLPWSDIADNVRAWHDNDEGNSCIALFAHKDRTDTAMVAKGTVATYLRALVNAFQLSPTLLKAAKLALLWTTIDNEDQES